MHDADRTADPTAPILTAPLGLSWPLGAAPQGGGRKMSKVGSLVLALFVALALGRAALARAQMEKITIAAPTNNVAFAYLFVALDKGYFTAEGIDPNVQAIDGATAISGLIAGSVAYSASPASALSAIVRGAPLKVIFFAQLRASEDLWSFDPDVKSFDDLKGRMIVIGARGGSEEMMLRALLKAHGLPENYWGFRTLGIGPMKLAALKSGAERIAMVGRLEQGDLRRAGVLDHGRVIVDFTKEVEMPNGGMATSDREIAQHRARAEGVMRAIAEGMMFMREERAETVDAVAKRFPQVTHDDIAAAIDEAVTNSAPDGTISTATAQRELAVRSELIGAPASAAPPIEKAFDFSIIRKADADLKAANWQPTK
jgi:NitT/TauT family transport system substrate-binding protein